MKNLRIRIATLIGATALALGALTATATTAASAHTVSGDAKLSTNVAPSGGYYVSGVASAASTLVYAGYNGACGSGYGVIDYINVSGQDTGTVYLTYNSGNGYNCVVTVRAHPGTPIYMDAAVRVSGGTWHEDFGDYTTYAGPVYVYARGTCIDWGGGINPDYQYRYSVHCG